MPVVKARPSGDRSVAPDFSNEAWERDMQALPADHSLRRFGIQRSSKGPYREDVHFHDADEIWVVTEGRALVEEAGARFVLDS